MLENERSKWGRAMSIRCLSCASEAELDPQAHPAVWRCVSCGFEIPIRLEESPKGSRGGYDECDGKRLQEDRLGKLGN